MGPAGRLGLWLVLSIVPRAALQHQSGGAQPTCVNDTHCSCPPGFRAPPGPPGSAAPQSCDDINECLEGPSPCGPGQSCSNTPGGFSCDCNRGYRLAPPRDPPPGTGDPPTECVDIDECKERGSGLCRGGFICFNTPGDFECHCPPGHVETPSACTPVTVPPELCEDEKGGCELAETLTHLYEQLGGGGDPHLVLQDLLATLEGPVGGCGAEPPPRCHRRVTALLAATEGLVGGAGGLLTPPTATNVTSNGSALFLSVFRGPPPGPVHLGGPGVQLEVPKGGAGDSGVSLVALLQHRALALALSGAPPVDWGGWGELPPPRRGARPSYRLLSPVVTVLVTPPRPPGPPDITLSFQHPPPDPRLGGRVLCAFWHPELGRWATRGCRALNPPTPLGTTCVCNHLTSFAVLLAFYELQDNWVLDVVTRVSLGVSVVALGVAAATFALCRALKGLRTTLHLHLSLSLLVAHGTFLLGIDRTESPVACAVVAGLLHFSFLAAFCWMGLEGLHLYVLLVRVFEPSWLRVRHLLLVGYGVPALIVAIAAAAFPAGYGTDRYCWLSLDRGFRWSFQGPVCLVIALNAVILVVTVWKLVQKFHDVNPDLGHLRKIRVLSVTAGGQLCLLGSGWALGLGLGLGLPPPAPPAGPPPALLVLFCLVNAAQGLLILLCHCLAHPQVREAYRSCLCPGSKRYSEFTSNTSNTSNTRLSRQQAYA